MSRCKKASKIKSLNTALTQLTRMEEQENKKYRAAEVKHTKAMTSELKKQGRTTLLSKETVTQLMKTMSDSIRLVIFNNCFSGGQAEAVTEYIECSIGMNEAVRDDAAREFAAQFYSAIAFGKSVQNAFEQGKLALMLAGIDGDDIPELYTRDSIDPNQLVLVRP